MFAGAEPNAFTYIQQSIVAVNELAVPVVQVLNKEVLVVKLLLEKYELHPVALNGLNDPCVVLPLRVIVKLFDDESKNVLFCAPLAALSA